MQEMIQKSVIFHFPPELYDKPVISGLIRNCEVEVNILEAYISPQQAGHMFAILQGEEGRIDDALRYMEGMGVSMVLPVRNLVWDETKCVHCGACVGQCRPRAFRMESSRVVFDSARCVACNLCIPSCSYGAIESISSHLKRKGEI